MRERRYFRRLQRRYQADLGLPPLAHQKSEEGSAASSPTSQSAAGSEDEVVDGEARVPITCINLLRCNMQAKPPLDESTTVVDTANTALTNCFLRVRE